MKKTTTDFQIYLKQSAAEIEKELRYFSTEWNDYIAEQLPHLKELNKRFTESLFGGKMLRGTLVRLGYELVQQKSTAAIMKPAAAFEIVHTAFLIHDDIIDQSPTRRGKPALHIHNSETHYGMSQALCLGDLGLILANRLIIESDFPDKNKLQAIAVFQKIKTDTILGEMLDVEAPRIKNRDEELIMDIHLMKTANYTIVGPLSVGAILAGADDNLLKAIKYFGEKLGVAYQIQDDILGIFGNETKIGKSTTSDIEENKSTLLLTYAVKQGTAKQKELLKKYYGKKGLTPKQQELIKNVFEETGARQYNQRKIEQLIAEAKTTIPSVTDDKTRQSLLDELCDVLLTRNE